MTRSLSFRGEREREPGIHKHEVAGGSEQGCTSFCAVSVYGFRARLCEPPRNDKVSAGLTFSFCS